MAAEKQVGCRIIDSPETNMWLAARKNTRAVEPLGGVSPRSFSEPGAEAAERSRADAGPARLGRSAGAVGRRGGHRRRHSRCPLARRAGHGPLSAGGAGSVAGRLNRRALSQGRGCGAKQVRARRREFAMKRLSLLDALFLYAETPETPMHIARVTIFKPESPQDDLFARFREHTESASTRNRRFAALSLLRLK